MFCYYFVFVWIFRFSFSFCCLFVFYFRCCCFCAYLYTSPNCYSVATIIDVVAAVCCCCCCLWKMLFANILWHVIAHLYANAFAKYFIEQKYFAWCKRIFHETKAKKVVHTDLFPFGHDCITHDFDLFILAIVYSYSTELYANVW